MGELKLVEDYIPIIALFGFIGLGVLSKILLDKYNCFNKFIEYLSKVVYYILLSAVFLDTFASRGLELADANVAITTLIYVVISIAILVNLRFLRDPISRRAVAITSTFQNSVFLGFPVLMIVYGDIGAAAMYGLMMFILQILISGLLAVAKQNLLKAILKIPVIYGFSIGVTMHYLFSDIYQWMAPILAPTHLMLSYGAVYVLGATIPLSIKPIAIHKIEALIIGLWRFLISPIIHYILITILELPPLYEAQIMVLSIMPPAVMNTVIARIYNWKPEMVASTTMLHTFIGLLIIGTLLILNIL